MPRRTLPLLVALLTVSTLLPAAAAPAEPARPSLELRRTSERVVARHGRNEPVYLNLGVYLASLGAPFEIWVTRPAYDQPVQVAQALVAEDGSRTMEPLPAETLGNRWTGFKGFFQIEIRRDGELVRTKKMAFCPNAYERQRIDDSGPDRPAYPEGCYANPFTKAVIWGIDQGWAVDPAASTSALVRIPNGTYEATMSVAPDYVQMFGLTGRTSATVELVVKTYRDDYCRKCPIPGHSAERTASREIPTMEDPDPALLPDLVALPAWGIGIMKGRTRDRLSFGATVWTGGASSVVVEGFRAEGQPYMDAYQYFYDGDEVVGRSPVGRLDFDDERGHNHWHFQQFAAYSLLDSTQTEVVRSRKEAFCLAPTDAIDLSLPGAVWSPGRIGLWTACGNPNSLWVREVLPLGWGDTYFQGLPGQSFDITGLPNGTYYVKVEANPGGQLHEQSADNNVELREVILGGTRGARTVEVPPWNGIDSEGWMGRG